MLEQDIKVRGKNYTLVYNGRNPDYVKALKYMMKKEHIGYTTVKYAAGAGEAVYARSSEAFDSGYFMLYKECGRAIGLIKATKDLYAERDLYVPSAKYHAKYDYGGNYYRVSVRYGRQEITYDTTQKPDERQVECVLALFAMLKTVHTLEE